MDTGRSFDSASPASSARDRDADFQQHGGGGFGMTHGRGSGSGMDGTGSMAVANVSALLAPLPPLTLQVQVRDVTLQVEVGPGTQTCKWLASTCAASYAATRREAAVGGAQYLPVHLSDARSGQPLFPEDILCEKLEAGDTVKLELLGPRLGPSTPGFARERSLWELYAWHSLGQPQALVPVVLLFDASELALNAPPAIFGNFNAWGVPMPMNYYKDNTYKFQMEFPAGSELVFKFVVGGASLLTPKVYPLVHDSAGNKLHYLRVAPVPPNESMDALYASPLGVSTGGVGVSSYPNPALQAAQATQALDLSAATQGRRVLTLKQQIQLNQRAQAAWQAEQKLRRNGPELPVLSQRVVGSFPTSVAHRVPKSNPRDNARRFARDWTELARNIADVFPPTIPAPQPDPEVVRAAALRSPGGVHKLPTSLPQPQYAQKLSDLRGVLAKYHAELSSLFSYYAHGTPGLVSRGPSWNLLSFLAFMQLVQVADPLRATVARLDRIYFKVLESRDPSWSSANGGGGGGGELLRGRNPVALGAAELRSGNNSVGKMLLQHENLWSGLNALTRPEFVQALLRVAMLKFPNPASLAEYMPLVEEKTAQEDNSSHKIMMTSAAGMAALQAKQEAEAKRLAAQALPRDPPRVLEHPNPALSLELLLKLHLLPFAASSGVVQAAGATASTASLLGLPQPQSFNPLDLRARLLLDSNVFALLRQYSDQLHALFRHYTGGAETSGLGLGLPSQTAGLPGAAAHAGIVGGANGANPALLPPTLLGASMQTTAPGGLLGALLPAPGRPFAASHQSNGALKSSSSSPVASATIHLRELEQLLADYELLDCMLPRPRALQQIGIVLEGGQGDDATSGSGSSGGAGLGSTHSALGSVSSSDGSGNGGGGEVSLELLYPEFLELLVRIADTGHQWSDLHLAQQSVIAHAYASGALNPLDKVPASLLASAGVAGHGGFGGRALDDEELDDASAASIAGGRADETELCERLARVLSWIFPNEQQQRERRAKMAAQASASAAPAAAAPAAAGAAAAGAPAAGAAAGAPPGTADAKGAKSKSGSASAKGAPAKTPVKASSAAKKK